ncbi:CBS and ACT domain-containing protein [Desulfovibrio inopinatus]|uniref:CBS and ACT domain-containing protein n=1 Tax=Desulfovibrio inopinatus TaxID=102109 RepID=UPI0003F53D02|nr:CBS and ACT domain-containing protein [Desulfovibrio inopinatus]
MLVKDWMTEGLYNLGVNDTVLDAADMLRRNNIRQLPVIDTTGRLVGIVSDRDIRDAMPSKFLEGDATKAEAGKGLFDLKVKKIMTEDPITISPDSTVDTAANFLLNNKVGGLPVIDTRGALVGIITETDIFKYLCAVTGVCRQGIQLVFKLEDTPGAAIDLLSYLKGEEIRLSSVLTSYEKVEYGYREVSIRVQSTGKHSLETLITMLKDKYTLLYYIQDGKAKGLDSPE